MNLSIVWAIMAISMSVLILMKGIRREARGRFHLVGVRRFGSLLAWPWAMQAKLVPSENENVMVAHAGATHV